MLKQKSLYFAILLLTAACTGATRQEQATAPDSILTTKKVGTVLVSDSDMRTTLYDNRVDELFDDFLFSYLQDDALQQQRTDFPVLQQMQDGAMRSVLEQEFRDSLSFMRGEYTTNLFTSEQDKSLNEDTALDTASLEKIDLAAQTVTSYNFVRVEGKWRLLSLVNNSFADSDMCSFLEFYRRFVTDVEFQKKSLARSIHISVMDPDDDQQTVDGFITRDQWPSISSDFPSGIITNIRYGQVFTGCNTILLEKVSMGDGMAETFTFRRNRQRWELVGYEN